MRTCFCCSTSILSSILSSSPSPSSSSSTISVSSLSLLLLMYWSTSQILFLVITVRYHRQVEEK
ncbi:ORF1122 [White spot syndrome virus]|uniref:ORF1122 n=1 Tax=White spot syndrome virus TaxID=342409 RepID=A0A2D3I6X7_9VIRU|nr:ORF1122 [White spot syndrome virus]